MGERLLCKQEVIGSNPFTSTTVAAPLRPRDRRRASNAESAGGAGGVRCAEKSEATPPGEPGGGLIEG